MDLQEKTALITGGSRGIGYAVAERFLREGANVVITARNTDGLEKAAEQLHQIPAGAITTVPGDVSHEYHVDKWIDTTLKEYGSIDVLVNNAGISRNAEVHRLSSEDFKAVQDTNLFGTFLMCHKVLPTMKNQQRGFIFNMASFAGTKGLPRSGAYGSSKAGVIRLSETLQRELKEDNIKVTAICPGYVYTEMTESTGVPQTEMIQPEDIPETMMYVMRLSGASLVQRIVIERFGSI
ncbi:MAG TPA: SDR family oxidoreductase [bacterium]|nr:SDR family oxidoreductase [bacterium]